MVIIDRTKKTPEIRYDASKGEILMVGVLIPEDPRIFFGSLDSIIKECLQESNKISIEFRFDYFNTGSARYLYSMFQDLKQHSSLEITWVYESDDEDIYESGKGFEELCGITFNFIEK